MGNCFKVALPIGFRIGVNLEHQITVKFNSSVNNPPDLKGIVVAKNNPELFGKKYDGEHMTETIGGGHGVTFRIEEKRSVYLPGKCRNKSILEYISFHYINSDMNCSMKCKPKDPLNYFNHVRDLDDVPICPDSESTNCVMKWLSNVLRKAKKYCFKKSYNGVKDVSKINLQSYWCSKVVYSYISL